MVELVSTKGGRAVPFREALLRGFAPDGGLVVPLTHPDLSPEVLRRLRPLGYWGIVSHLLIEYGASPKDSPAEREALEAVIRGAVRDASLRFEGGSGSTGCAGGDAPDRQGSDGGKTDPVPVAGPFHHRDVGDGDGNNNNKEGGEEEEEKKSSTVGSVGDDGEALALYVMELHRGPTLAFKDLGLQVIAALMDRVLEESGRVASLLVATSGDTGSAALRAFENRRRASMTVLFPRGKVSRIQELQMTAVGAPNTRVLAVENSTSDSLDRILYGVFGDADFSRETSLGSVNSFNFVRIIVQAAHFVHGYLRCVPEGSEGENVTFAIPTGAFGNAVSAHLTRLAGLPISILVANGPNDPVHRLISTGKLAAPPGTRVIETSSRAIDIGVPYNIERSLWLIALEKSGGGPEALPAAASLTARWMSALHTADGVTLDPQSLHLLRGVFSSAKCSDAETLATVAAFARGTGYVCDPHTAVGIKAAWETAGKGKVVVAATASPAKFRPDVEKALEGAGVEVDVEKWLVDPVIVEIEGAEDNSIPMDQGQGDDACAKQVMEVIRALHGNIKGGL